MDRYVSRRVILRLGVAAALTHIPFVSAASDQNTAPSKASPKAKHDFIEAAMKERDEDLSRQLEEMAKKGIHPLMRVSTLMPFGDWDFYYVKGGEISWGPNTDSDSIKIEVTVPEGFVTDLASIPSAFWSIRRPEGRHAFAAVVHDFLYWTQTKTREEADNIFKQAMLDSRVGKKEAESLYQAVRFFGQSAWENNKELKKNGERRFLKKFPTDYTVSWNDWKKVPDVFIEN